MDAIIKIITVDDHKLIRGSLKLLLEENPSFKIIGEAENGKDLMRLLKGELPDIILLDVAMPVMDGYAVQKRIKTRFPSIKVIILSNYGDEQMKIDFLINGIRGYLNKSADISEIEKAIQIVFEGNYYYEKSVTKSAISLIIKTASLQLRKVKLSPTETEVLKLICEEKSSLEISKILFITEKTVENHRSSIYKKTQIKSIVGLVKFAIRNGISGIE